jgi:hypothetical protein
MPQSRTGIVWLASSDAEIAQARHVLKSMHVPGVLDELGFLVLLGALSDRLYPAVNTIMTRARYLVFLPAIFRHIEEKQLVGRRSFDSVSRDLQYDLRTALLQQEGNQRGVIGADAGRDIARLPSNIYWTALTDLRIATHKISESAYGQRLASTKRVRLQDDDGAVQLEEDDSFWDTSFSTRDILSEGGGFSSETSFSLTVEEATALQKRYAALRPDDGTSLLSHIISRGIRRPGSSVQFDWPWDVPDQPADLARVTEHARRLSLFSHGATLQYHALLFQKKRADDTGTGVAFAEWWEAASEDVALWDLQDFFALPCISGALRQGDALFLREWSYAIAEARSSTEAYGSGVARKLLESRELAMRGAKARLKSRHHLRLWNEPASYAPSIRYGLSYRHGIGTRFASDITRGLRQGGDGA